MKPLVKNASDQEQVKNAENKILNGEEKYNLEIQALMSEKWGRSFVWRWLGKCGIYKTSYTGNSETFFLEGQRSIGLRLLADITRVDPNGYVLMIKENQEGNL